jgi:hypothetical protein
MSWKFRGIPEWSKAVKAKLFPSLWEQEVSSKFYWRDHGSSMIDVLGERSFFYFTQKLAFLTLYCNAKPSKCLLQCTILSQSSVPLSPGALRNKRTFPSPDFFWCLEFVEIYLTQSTISIFCVKSGHTHMMKSLNFWREKLVWHFLWVWKCFWLIDWKIVWFRIWFAASFTVKWSGEGCSIKKYLKIALDFALLIFSLEYNSI